MCETFLHVMYRPKMGIVKARKLGLRSKIFLFSETVQGYGNRSADICLAGSWVGWAFSLYVNTMISTTEIFRILLQLFVPIGCSITRISLEEWQKPETQFQLASLSSK